MKRLVFMGLSIALLSNGAATAADATPKKELRMLEAKLDTSLIQSAPLKGSVAENLVLNLQNSVVPGLKQVPAYGRSSGSNTTLQSNVKQEAWSSNKVASGSWGVPSGSWNKQPGSWNVQNNGSWNSNNNSGSWGVKPGSWNLQNNSSWNSNNNSGSWGVKPGSWNVQNNDSWNNNNKWFVQPDSWKIQYGVWNVQSGSWGLQIGSWMSSIAAIFRI